MLAAILTGCAPDKYSPENYTLPVNEMRMDALNYSLYVNKEITEVLNLLEQHMASAEMIKRDTGYIATEKLAVAETLDMVDESIQSVAVIYPPEEYEDDQAMVLRRMRDVKDTLTQYQQYLAAGTNHMIENYIDQMNSNFVALKATFNNWTE